MRAPLLPSALALALALALPSLALAQEAQAENETQSETQNEAQSETAHEEVSGRPLRIAIYPSALSSEPTRLRTRALLERISADLQPEASLSLLRPEGEPEGPPEHSMLHVFGPTSVFPLGRAGSLRWRDGREVREALDSLAQTFGVDPAQMRSPFGPARREPGGRRPEALRLAFGAEERREDLPPEVLWVRIDPEAMVEAQAEQVERLCDHLYAVEPDHRCERVPPSREVSLLHRHDRLISFSTSPESPTEVRQGAIGPVLGTSLAVLARHRWEMPAEPPRLPRGAESHLLGAREPADLPIEMSEAAEALRRAGALRVRMRLDGEPRPLSDAPRRSTERTLGSEAPRLRIPSFPAGRHLVELFYADAEGREGPASRAWLSAPFEQSFGWIRAGEPRRCAEIAGLGPGLGPSPDVGNRAEGHAWVEGRRLCLRTDWWASDELGDLRLRDREGRIAEITYEVSWDPSFWELLTALVLAAFLLVWLSGLRPLAEVAVLKEDREGSFRARAGARWVRRPVTDPSLGLRHLGPLAWVPVERSLDQKTSTLRPGVEFSDPKGNLWCLVDGATAAALEAGELDALPPPRLRTGVAVYLLLPLLLTALSAGLPALLGLGERDHFLALCFPLFLLGVALLFRTRLVARLTS